MAADIINLRRARKQKVRAGKAAQAAANRVKFGSTKAERERHTQQEVIERRRLDGHVRGRDSDES